MDFTAIKKEITKYLDKQHSNLLANPHLLKTTVKKLELYVESFHDEMKEMLEADGVKLALSPAVQLRKPFSRSFEMDNPAHHSDKTRVKLVSLSTQLMNETHRRGKYIRSAWSGAASDVYSYQDTVKKIIGREIDFIYDGTLLKQVVERIYYHLWKWQWEQSVMALERLYQELRSPRVLEDLKNSGGSSLESVANQVIAPYRTYFAECLSEYAKLYLIDPTPQDTVPSKKAVCENVPAAKPLEAIQEDAADYEETDEASKSGTDIAVHDIPVPAPMSEPLHNTIEIESNVTDGMSTSEQIHSREPEVIIVHLNNGDIINLNIKDASKEFMHELLQLISLQAVRNISE